MVAAAGTLDTPGLLARSGVDDPLVGRNLGFHPARIVCGLFDHHQDAHMVYPITAHCADRRNDADGGFVVEAVTVQDPIGFATTVEDENGPLWGPPLVEALRRYRDWTGLLGMTNDDNNGAVVPARPDSATATLTPPTSGPDERARLDGALSVRPRRARGGRRERGAVDRPRHHPHAGQLPDGHRPDRARSSTPTARRTPSGGSSSATAP